MPAKRKQPPSDLTKKTPQQGFSLLEAVVTVTIMAFISAIAVPAFSSSLKRWEANTVRSQVTNAIRTAKAQSLIQRQDILMCFADSHYVCHKQATDFLLIFVDTDNNSRYTPNSNPLILKQALNLNYGRVYLRAANRHYIKFFGDSGLPRGHFGHIKYCPDNGDTSNMFQISINQQGNHRFKPYKFKKTGCPN